MTDPATSNPAATKEPARAPARTASSKSFAEPVSSLDLPAGANPTGLLAQRSQTWNKLVKVLINYLREVSTVCEETTKLNERAARSIDTSFLESAPAPSRGAAPTATNSSQEPASSDSNMFLGVGSESVADFPVTLVNMHREVGRVAQAAVPVIRGEFIPRLEQLRRDLQQAQTEFTGMSSKFRVSSQLKHEQQSTQSLIGKYTQAVESVLAGHSSQSDPYPLKVQVESQLNRQLSTENSLLSAHKSLQALAQEVEQETMRTLQEVLKELSNILGSMGDAYVANAASIVDGVGSKPPLYELQAFMGRERGSFINSPLPEQQTSGASYKHQHSNLARAIRQGSLERRTKYLKSFSKGEYVLTPQSLIEYRNDQPVLTIDLDGAALDNDHKHASGDRFVLQANSSDAPGKKQAFVFRADDANNWIEDIKTVLSHKNPRERVTSLFGGLEQEAPAAAVGTAAGAATGAAGSKSKGPAPPTGANSGATGAGGEIPGANAGTSGSGAAGSGAAAGVTGGGPAPEGAASSHPGHSEAPKGANAGASGAGGVAGPSSDAAEAAVAGTAAGAAAGAAGAHVRRPSNYKKDQSSPDTLTSSVGAAKGGAHEVDGVDVCAPGVSTPSAYRKSDDFAISDDAETSSVFSYDLKHPTSTFSGDDYEPEALPPKVERRLTQTSHKTEQPEFLDVARTAREADESPERLLQRRRSSVSSGTSRRASTRRATGSYGDGLKPLTANVPGGLFFASELPSTTSGQAE